VLVVLRSFRLRPFSLAGRNAATLDEPHA